jgi:dipeptidyl aminopeptidase/acylaminoacyl peptidase
MLLLVACLVVPVFATPSFQYQLATGGDFESGLTAWAARDQSTQGAWSATGLTRLPVSGRATPGPALGRSFAATDGHGWDTCVLTQKFSVSYACTVAVGFDVFANEWAAPAKACPEGIGYRDGLRPARLKTPGWRVDILKQTADPFSIAAPDIVSHVCAGAGSKVVFQRSPGWTHRCILLSLQPGDYTLRLGVLADLDAFNAGFDNVSLSAGHPHHEIVFDSSRNNTATPALTDVYLYNQTMNFIDPTPGLNSPTASDSCPALSADGHYIVFRSGRTSIYHPTLYLWDRVTRALAPLPGLASGASESFPSISADGRFIAFTSDRPGVTGGAGDFDIFLYDRNTSSIVPLPGLNSAKAEMCPSISADGRLIAFASSRTGNCDIYLYDRETRSLVNLPGINNPNFDDLYPSLIADGHFIAFQSKRIGPGNGDIYLYDLTTKALVATPNLNTADEELTPSISWDGRYIAFGYRLHVDGKDEDIRCYDRTTGAIVTLGAINSKSYDGEPMMR